MDPITLVLALLFILLILLTLGAAAYFLWPTNEEPQAGNLPLHARLSQQGLQGRPSEHFSPSDEHSFASMPRAAALRPRPPEPPAPPAAPEEPAAPPAPPSPRERFATEPEAAFFEQFQLVDNVLQESREKLRRIDERFAVRMHKNTQAEIANHLRAKDLVEALSQRRNLMAEVLEGSSARGQTAEDAFEIAFGKVEVGGNSLGSLNVSEQPKASLDVDEVGREIQRIILEFQRRKTFYNAIFPKNLLGGS